MPTVWLDDHASFGEWRDKARQLLLAGYPPDTIHWLGPGATAGLLEDGGRQLYLPPVGATAATVPPGYIDLAEAAICHADGERFALLYRLLWRLQEDRGLLGARSDPDVQRLERMAAAVRRDAHKMKAFVRFKSVVDPTGRERFAAWFEPEHHILERVAPFFARRFTGMNWAIVTPSRTVFWDGSDLTYGPGGQRSDVPADDALEDTWRTYFSSIFNPARLKVQAMKSEMPVRYWRNLPEARLIPTLIESASRKVREMIHHPATEPPVRHQRQVRRQAEATAEAESEITSLAAARAAIQGCRRCPLFEFATQAVFGEGPKSAEVMFVGEQPGDQEDLAGKPFVGPAGKVFDAALEKSGIDRRRTYVTNAVKHFKFVPRGKRRLHQKPNGGEIAACRFWLDLEREFVKPKLVVALGATAVQSLLGRAATISSLRGKPLELDDGTLFLATIHPSYLLRIREREGRMREERAFEADLAVIREIMDGGYRVA
ncbi:MAG TPA: UdgX family uracil-DNA binding protein [Devosiaceae bacterium]|jgi:DNA polymerase|nr:UdgX family uracil-DNA binding protein [Devosiaceae bacterium]